MRRTITGSLVFIIAASYLLQLVIPGYEERFLLSRGYIESGQFYRLLTVALLHGGLWHLGFNLYALHVLGTPVESFFGKPKYILFFLFRCYRAHFSRFISTPHISTQLGLPG